MNYLKVLATSIMLGCFGTLLGQDASNENQKVIIDYLYLALDGCSRCSETKDELVMALEEVREELQVAGLEAQIELKLIATQKEATYYRLSTSPTIRVNGHEIQAEYRETDCKDCSVMACSRIACRSWVVAGEVYAIPPKEYLKSEILRLSQLDRHTVSGSFRLSRNLKKFFRQKSKLACNTKTSCKVKTSSCS